MGYPIQLKLLIKKEAVCLPNQKNGLFHTGRSIPIAMPDIPQATL